MENLSLPARDAEVYCVWSFCANPSVRADADEFSGADQSCCHVRFSVVDKGPGITPGNQAFLFNLFQQVSPARAAQAGRAGVGLAISKAIIDVHGGTIGVESREGTGSTFWFQLPLLPDG